MWRRANPPEARLPPAHELPASIGARDQCSSSCRRRRRLRLRLRREIERRPRPPPPEFTRPAAERAFTSQQSGCCGHRRLAGLIRIWAAHLHLVVATRTPRAAPARRSQCAGAARVRLGQRAGRRALQRHFACGSDNRARVNAAAGRGNSAHAALQSLRRMSTAFRLFGSDPRVPCARGSGN